MVFYLNLYFFFLIFILKYQINLLVFNCGDTLTETLYFIYVSISKSVPNLSPDTKKNKNLINILRKHVSQKK